MSQISRTQSMEKGNLQQLMAAEEAALQKTAQALSATLKARFERNPDNVRPPASNAYTQQYTDAMELSWLMGQYHVMLQVTPGQLNFADEPDTDMTFDEALAYLRAQVPVSGNSYRNMEASIKLRAFTVAAVSNEQAVSDVKRLYEKALSEGQTAPEAMQNFNQYLDSAGVSPANPYYLALHYRNNMMTSYNGGRWTQVADNDVVEYLIYISVLDSGTTQLCRHLDHMVKPKGDPFWQKYYPPNHHFCRGTVSAYTATQYEALPEHVRSASERITAHSVEQDSAMAAEHQFKGSPVNRMAGLPAALLEQAQAFGLVDDILSQTRQVSGSQLTARHNRLRGEKVAPDVIRRAVKDDSEMDPFAELAAGIVQNADETRLGFEAISGESDPMLTLQYLQQADGETWIAGSAPAFTDDGVVSVRRLTKEELEKHRRDGQRFTPDDIPPGN